MRTSSIVLAALLLLLLALLTSGCTRSRQSTLWPARLRERCGPPPKVAASAGGRWDTKANCWATPAVAKQCAAYAPAQKAELRIAGRCGGPPPGNCERERARYLYDLRRTPCRCTTRAMRVDCSNRP
ncbi:MAG: hypothetical protein KC503_45300 [Myxococcales bacterium]|nr:hypothetical protein [Myxococcales bacterium]